MLPNFAIKQSWVQRPSWQGEPRGMTVNSFVLSFLLDGLAVFQAVKVAVGTLQEAK